MGNFSRHTFDKLKHYVGVRLQQGVPIIDADWNEQDDVRRFELQAFLKWFVGNGVPHGDDGFRVRGYHTGSTIEPENDFGIAAGRCLVEGWDAINEHGATYVTQRLFGDPELAEAWGVAPLPPLTTPSVARKDVVYLDVWEREVGAAEDPSLVNPAIGIETSVRLKREWVVRVAEGAFALPDAPAGHVFYELAVLLRPAGSPAVLDAHLLDQRRTGLTVASHQHIQQITADAYGTGYELDMDGQPNLKVSLRDAVNALLRNQLPGTPAQALTRQTEVNFARGTPYLTDSEGATWAFWYSVRDEKSSLWYKRRDPATDTWSEETHLTTGTTPDPDVHALEDRDGNVWVFWNHTESGEERDVGSVWYSVYGRAAGEWRAEVRLTSAADNAIVGDAVVDRQGNLWVFWMQFASIQDNLHLHLWCNRRDHATGNWGTPTQLTSGTVWDNGARVVVDGKGDLWLFFARDIAGKSDIWHMRYFRTTSTWNAPAAVSVDAASDWTPAPVVDGDGVVWVFWHSTRTGGGDIYYTRWQASTSRWEPDTQLTSGPSSDQPGTPLVGSQGDLWMFWYHYGVTREVWYKRYHRDTGWGSSVQLATSPSPLDLAPPQATVDADGDIQVFWGRFTRGTRTTHMVLWNRKLVTAI